MEWYETEVRELEKKRRRQLIPRCPAVFYGSSSVRLWVNLAGDLENPRAYNLGFGGSTLAACVHFFERLVVPVRPSSLVLYAGDNDLGDGGRPEQVLASFRAFLIKMDRHFPAIPLGFISIKPSPARISLMESIEQTNELIRNEMTERVGTFYIDVFEPMLSVDRQPRPELFLDDGLHMSPAGYRLWTEVLRRFRNQIFMELFDISNARLLSSSQDESGVSQVVQPPPEP